MSEPAIKIQQLTKQYGKLTALDGIDLEVAPGTFFGLLGPNGAGKTTTINILAGLSNKTSGEVKLFGYDLIQNYRECRRRVGLVPQEFNFDQFTKVKKILQFQGGFFGMSKSDCLKRADELLERFDLQDKADEPARALSGGMKRRLVIARAMMHRPQLLILDEPTAGVDVDLRKTLWSFLRELNEQGMTILLTTHYIEEAETLTDRIAIINKGKIIADDSTRQMSNRLTSETVILTHSSPIGDEFITRWSHWEPRLSADGFEVTLTFNKQEISYAECLGQVLESGFDLISIRPVDNRLERVFLDLTRSSNASA